MTPNANNPTPGTQTTEREPGPPRARNLGWDENQQAWRFLQLETGEEFFVDLFAVTPGHYQIAGKVYRRG
jgi:hypothetical protein